MNTYKISKSEIEGLAPLATGYKAIKWDLSTKGNSKFRYGEIDEDIVGTVWKVDGDIVAYSWGLHFSKDPANVFNFYEPLGYNRYFKVNAYEKFYDTKDGLKSVAQTIEFVEEYDLMQFIAKIKEFDRTKTAVRGSNAVSWSNAVDNSNAVNWSYAVDNSYAVRGSNAVSWSNAVDNSNAVNWSNAVRGSNAVRRSNAVRGSNAVSWSNAVDNSNAVNWSYAVDNSYAVRRSNAVSGSNAVDNSYAVRGSNAVSWSYGITQCEAVKNCIFCYKKDAIKYYIFNKKTTKDRFEEVYSKILSFNFKPFYMNWDEIKGNKEWWAFNFERLAANDNPWSSMPKEMLEYIKSLPEYNEEIFNAITGDLDKEELE